MSQSTSDVAVPDELVRTTGQAGSVLRASVWRRLLKSPVAVTSLLLLSLLVVTAALAGFLAPYDPNLANLGAVRQPPGGEYLLGTDSAGRDILSRLLFGTRVTLLAAALAASVAILIGLPTGLIAGYYGRSFDAVSSWLTNILLALPGIIVLLAVRAALGPSVWIAMIVFGILLSPGFFRLTRSAVQSVRNELYVDAARVAGLSDLRIIGRHILSVVRAPLIIQTAMVCGVAIAIQSALEFLGLGDPLVPTWGAMVGDGFRNIFVAPSILLWPTLVITITIATFVLLGNAVRDALEDQVKVKESRRQARQRTAASAAAVTERASGPVAFTATRPGEHNLLTVEHLSIGYPQPDGSSKVVVDDVSFHVDRNEVLGIVGESGSGKTQSAFAVLGLLPDNAVITSGSITFDGRPTVAEGAHKVDQASMGQLRGRRISYIPQEPMSNLDPSFKIGAQLTRPMVKLLGVGKAEASARAKDLLASVGIKDPSRTMNAYPHEISGGMAQRVLIAGAVSCEPDLIIADEPTTALDVTVQAEVLDVLRELQERLHQGVILVTHNFGVVADICDRVAVMQLGRLVEEGPVRSVLRSPQHSYTQMLLASTLENKPPMSLLLSEGDAQ